MSSSQLQACIPLDVAVIDGSSRTTSTNQQQVSLDTGFMLVCVS